MIIATRRALGLPWLGWYRRRQVRQILATLKKKMESDSYRKYNYASTLMCCTDEGALLREYIGIDALNKLNYLFNADITLNHKTNLSESGSINYPVAARYRHFFGYELSQAWWKKEWIEERDYQMAKIRKQLLDFWCMELIGEKL